MDTDQSSSGDENEDLIPQLENLHSKLHSKRQPTKKLWSIAMFLLGGGLVWVMYLFYGGSTAADYHQNGGGSGGFFHMSQRPHGEPLGITSDVVKMFIELEEQADQVGMMLNGSSKKGQEALDTVKKAAKGDYAILGHMDAMLGGTRRDMLAAANQGQFAANTFDLFFAFMDGANLRGTEGVEKLDKMVVEVSKQVTFTLEAFASDAMGPSLMHRRDLLAWADDLLAGREGELKERLTQPAGYFDGVWDTGRAIMRLQTVADMEVELQACKHLRETLKELMQPLESSTKAVDRYVGQLEKMVKSGIIGNANGWTDIETLREMAKAKDKELEEQVGANYEVSWEELAKRVKSGIIRNANGRTEKETLRKMAKAKDKELEEHVGANYEILWEELVKVRLIWP